MDRNKAVLIYFVDLEFHFAFPPRLVPLRNAAKANRNHRLTGSPHRYMTFEQIRRYTRRFKLTMRMHNASR